MFINYFITELMDLTDIEKFFNENFFKKIPTTANSKSDRSNARSDDGIEHGAVGDRPSSSFMHGVPESGYEPTINYNGGGATDKRDPFRMGDDGKL